MTQYIAVEVESTDEVLIALLSEYDFDAFHEEDTFFVGYIAKDAFDKETESQIIQQILSYTNEYKIYEVENRNWNAIWEASFQPVTVGNFCQVRADFHEPVPSIKHDIIINPKMAFGTGHHATTCMMIQLMENTDFKRKSVFDFGCGTGILAILASKMGADPVDAIDIEHEAYLNTIENAAVNQVEHITAYEGDLNVMPDDAQYDIILANINRNILLKYAADLAGKLKTGGIILLSGILNDDQEIVIDAFKKKGLRLQAQEERDNWVCLQLGKLG